MVPKGVFDTRVEEFIPSHYHLEMKHGWLGTHLHGQLTYVRTKGVFRLKLGLLNGHIPCYRARITTVKYPLIPGTAPPKYLSLSPNIEYLHRNPEKCGKHDDEPPILEGYHLFLASHWGWFRAWG